jgi:hypothetical protein
MDGDPCPRGVDIAHGFFERWPLSHLAPALADADIFSDVIVELLRAAAPGFYGELEEAIQREEGMIREVVVEEER